VAKVEHVAERMRTTVSARELSGGERSADDVVARLDAIDAALGEIQGLDPDKALERGAGPAGPSQTAAGPGSTPAPGSGAGTSTGTSWTEKVPWPGQRRPDRPGG
jgi:hypothetical protein